MSKRSRIVGFGSAGLLILAGIGCAFAFSGGLAQNLAFAFVALGLVEGTALVFYEVGLTEDHARARGEDRPPPPTVAPPAEESAEEASQPRQPRAAPTHGDGDVRPGSPRVVGGRLDRMRGRPRRLR